MSMTATGPMGLEKAIEHLQQLQAEAQSRGSEEEVIVIVSRR